MEKTGPPQTARGSDAIVTRPRMHRADPANLEITLDFKSASIPVKVRQAGGSDMNWVAVGSFFAGLVGGYTVKIVVDIRANKSVGQAYAEASDESVAQSGNVAGGHIAGGNIKIDSK
jgi:hypothetical protein